MRKSVNEWVQEGRFYIWRYSNPGHGWRGWHVTADPAGCRSVRNLLDRMHGGGPCHRALKLQLVTDTILSVPNYGHKIEGRFEKLRIDYAPELEDSRLSPEGTTLTMTLGPHCLRKLSAALAQVEVGDGDFGISTSNDRRAESWIFWWMPGESIASR